MDHIIYSNTMISTLAVDGLAVTFGIAHPSTASVPTSYYSMWHYNLLPLRSKWLNILQ